MTTNPFDSAISDLYSHAEDIGEAKSATYTPPAGAAVSCTVIEREDFEAAVTEGLSVEAWDQVKIFEVQLSELTDEPESGGTFTVGGTDYIVDAVVENDGREVKVRVR